MSRTSTLSARLQVTPEVEAILNRSCVDCHSHKTVWPWYSNVAPVSWYLTHDVNEGRRHWNVSNWPTDPKRSAHRLEEMCQQVEKGEMPLPIYVLTFGIPVTYFLEILRGIVLRGADFIDLLPHVVGLLICCVVILALSIGRFRKTTA